MVSISRSLLVMQGMQNKFLSLHLLVSKIRKHCTEPSWENREDIPADCFVSASHVQEHSHHLSDKVSLTVPILSGPPSNVSQIGLTLSPFWCCIYVGSWWVSQPCIILHVHSPFQNPLAHLDTHGLDSDSSPYTCFNMLEISETLPFTFIKNLIMILHSTDMSFICRTQLQHTFTKLQYSYKIQPLDTADWHSPGRKITKHIH